MFVAIPVVMLVSVKSNDFRNSFSKYVTVRTECRKKKKDRKTAVTVFFNSPGIDTSARR